VFTPMFIYVTPGAMGLLIYAPFQSFEWQNYLPLGAVFTALLFKDDLFGDGVRIFSKQNARSSAAIIQIHLTFLALLLGFMKLAPRIEPSLPNWLTDTFRARGSEYSIFDILFICAMLGMHLIERRWLYVESATNFSGTEDKSSQSSSANREEHL
jgi:hypothetical protein